MVRNTFKPSKEETIKNNIKEALPRAISTIGIVIMVLFIYAIILYLTPHNHVITHSVRSLSIDDVMDLLFN